MHDGARLVTPEKRGPDPDTPGVPPTPDERYVAVDPAILKAIKELWWLRQLDWRTLQQVQLILRVLRVDQADGRLVIDARLVRDLDE